jgi:hypothetical protein
MPSYANAGANTLRRAARDGTTCVLIGTGDR